MLFITGDTHSSFDRFTRKRFPLQRELTKEDLMLIAGDFGGVWAGEGERNLRKTEDAVLKELQERSFTTLFIPGNHENYDRLLGEEFPLRAWMGGWVRQIGPSLLMLLRGEVYEIQGKRFFTFGGARSHDISDGILDPSCEDFKERERRLKRRGKRNYRILGRTWWREELPSKEEMEHGLKNLERYDYQVDYVITHCAPTSLQEQLCDYEADYLTDYLEQIRQRVRYETWYFGHYHQDRVVTPKDILLYEQIRRVL